MGGKFSSPVAALSADRTFIVTGANSGMGYYVAKALAQLGGRVIVACRSEERANQAIEQMKKEHQEELTQKSAKTSCSTKPKPDSGGAAGDEAKPDSEKADDSNEASAAATSASNQVQTLNLEFMKLDLSSLASTMDFINAFKAKEYPLHTLVCNAGMEPTSKAEYTSDDLEINFQVNYLGHHLMLLHLLPLIKQSGPNSRVVFCTGGAFTFKLASFKVDDIQCKTSFNSTAVAANTKLFQVMAMYAFERRTKGSQIGWFAANPGMVNTPMLKKTGKVMQYTMASLQAVRLAKSSQQGAEVLLGAILDPAYDGRDAMFFDHKCAANSHNPGALAKNVEKQEVLWKYSLECLKDYISEDLLTDLKLPSEQATRGHEDNGDGEDTNKEAVVN